MTRYVRFCSCQLNAAMTLQKFTEINPAFCEVTKRCQTDPRIKGLPLSSFLIKPMQRITKYPLFVKRVRANIFNSMAIKKCFILFSTDFRTYSVISSGLFTFARGLCQI